MGLFRPPTKIGWVDIGWRFVQFVMGFVVIGYYGQYLTAARAAGKYLDSKWMYATIVGAISVFTSFIYLGLSVMSEHYAVALLWGCDFVLMLLWLVLFIIFGSMYISENPEGDKGIEQMKIAVRIDGVNLALWAISATVGLYLYYGSRQRKKSLHGGTERSIAQAGALPLRSRRIRWRKE